MIDYEYGGNGDPAFELGNIWQESDLSLDQLAVLVDAYTGRHLRHEVARAHLYGVMARYGWTLWASIQASVSPIDFDFWSWGMEKYVRAVEELDGPDLEHLPCRGGAPRLSYSLSSAATSGSMLCFGPVNHFFAETCHQMARMSRAPERDDRCVVDELPLERVVERVAAGTNGSIR